MLVVDDWLFMTYSRTLSSGAGCSGTISSRTCSGTESGIGTESMLVVEVISWFGSCCWALSVLTSSEAMLEAFSWFDT